MLRRGPEVRVDVGGVSGRRGCDYDHCMNTMYEILKEYIIFKARW